MLVRFLSGSCDKKELLLSLAILEETGRRLKKKHTYIQTVVTLHGDETETGLEDSS